MAKITTAFINCLNPIEVLPASLYRRVAGELIDMVINHVCDVIMKMPKIGPSEPEALLKFIKPLSDYEKILLDTTKRENTEVSVRVVNRIWLLNMLRVGENFRQ